MQVQDQRLVWGGGRGQTQESHCTDGAHRRSPSCVRGEALEGAVQKGSVGSGKGKSYEEGIPDR